MATSSSSTGTGSPRATARSTGWSGTRVWACTRAQGGPPPRPDQAPGAHDEREGLFGGRQPRREQV